MRFYITLLLVGLLAVTDTYAQEQTDNVCSPNLENITPCVIDTRRFEIQLTEYIMSFVHRMHTEYEATRLVSLLVSLVETDKYYEYGNWHFFSKNDIVEHSIEDIIAVVQYDKDFHKITDIRFTPITTKTEYSKKDKLVHDYRGLKLWLINTFNLPIVNSYNTPLEKHDIVKLYHNRLLVQHSYNSYEENYIFSYKVFRELIKRVKNQLLFKLLER